MEPIREHLIEGFIRLSQAWLDEWVKQAEGQVWQEEIEMVKLDEQTT